MRVVWGRVWLCVRVRVRVHARTRISSYVYMCTGVRVYHMYVCMCTCVSTCVREHVYAHHLLCLAQRGSVIKNSLSVAPCERQRCRQRHARLQLLLCRVFFSAVACTFAMANVAAASGAIVAAALGLIAVAGTATVLRRITCLSTGIPGIAYISLSCLVYWDSSLWGCGCGGRCGAGSQGARGGGND